MHESTWKTIDHEAAGINHCPSATLPDLTLNRDDAIRCRAGRGRRYTDGPMSIHYNARQPGSNPESHIRIRIHTFFHLPSSQDLYLPLLACVAQKQNSMENQIDIAITHILTHQKNDPNSQYHVQDEVAPREGSKLGSIASLQRSKVSPKSRHRS